MHDTPVHSVRARVKLLGSDFAGGFLFLEAMQQKASFLNLSLKKIKLQALLLFWKAVAALAVSSEACDGAVTSVPKKRGALAQRSVTGLQCFRAVSKTTQRTEMGQSQNERSGLTRQSHRIMDRAWNHCPGASPEGSRSGQMSRECSFKEFVLVEAGACVLSSRMRWEGRRDSGGAVCAL